MPTIKLNDRGPEVRKLQLLLNSLVTPRPNLRVVESIFPFLG